MDASILMKSLKWYCVLITSKDGKQVRIYKKRQSSITEKQVRKIIERIKEAGQLT